MFTALISLALLSAKDADRVLWQVGKPDGLTSGYSLANGDYSKYKQDGLFVAGYSTDESWPALLPGPDDSWAGSRSHEHLVACALKSIDAGAHCKVVVRLCDSHWGSPPKLQLLVNGKAVGSFQTPKGKSDASLSGDLSKASKSEWSVAIPMKALKKGTNVISLRNSTGSWALLDSVRMEGAGVELEMVKPDIAVSAQPQEQAVYRSADGPIQKVNLDIVNLGPAGPAKWSVGGGKSGVANLVAGRQSLAIEVPAVAKDTEEQIAIEISGKTIKKSVKVEAVRPWKVVLIPHSHIDVGYTNIQTEVEVIHHNDLMDAISLRDETKAFPDGSKYRFTVEGTWSLERFFSKANPTEAKMVEDALKDGWMRVQGTYGNYCASAMRPEELLRGFHWSEEYRQKFGIPIEVASQTDAPGMTWGMVSAMNQAGLKYLLLWPNPSDRIGGARKYWEDKPFYWVGPSGNEKILVWPMTAYGVGHWLGGGFPDRFKMRRTNDPSGHFIDQYIFGHLRGLADSGYKYDIYPLPWSLSDNCPIDADAPYAVKAWNEKYVTPHVELGTGESAVKELEARFSKLIPTTKGDFSTYWEDGVGSSAAETALNRASADRLVQAETLFALLQPTAFPSEKITEAWRNTILYSEHTWGAYNSISEPDSDFVKQQWAIKQSYALTADKLSHELLGTALMRNGRGNALDVFNTSSWPRTDLVLIPADKSGQGDRVEDASGKALPSQRLASGELAVLVEDVPGFGSVRLQVKPGQPVAPKKAVSVADWKLSSDRYDVQVDAKTGRLSQVKDLTLGKDLVDTASKHGVNQYLYLPGVDLKDLKTNAKPTFEVVDKGPLVATVRMTSSAPGSKSLIQEVRLVAGLGRVDLTNKLDKIAIREKEGLHFAFPFAVPNGQMRVGAAWGVFRPEDDQLKGSCKEWLNTQRFVDVSNDLFGVTWSSLDAPLFEVGDITARVLGGRSNPDEWMQHLPKTQTLYSWALNNHWHTNYRADQEGWLTFRYSIASHGKLDTSAAERFGTELSQPLVLADARGQETTPLLSLSTNDVIVTSLKPSDDGKAYIVRLYGACGKPRKVSLNWRKGTVTTSTYSDLSEKPGKPAATTVDVTGFGVVTIRAERVTP